MLTFYPEFEVDSISENEIIFLLDLSNSMRVSEKGKSVICIWLDLSHVQGQALTYAKKILLLLLHHLPKKCLFNVFTFGAGMYCIQEKREGHIKPFFPLAAYEVLFPSSVPKTKDTLNTAQQFIQVCSA